MTCSKCGETTHTARTCGQQPKGKGKVKQQTKMPRTLIDEQTEEDINCSAPPTSQPSQDNDFRFMPTPRFRSVGQSSKDMKVDQDVVLRPRVISEVNTRLKMRMQVPIPTGTRSITFTGVSDPTNLPYTPPSLSWKGKHATTANQLEKQRQERIGKLRPRKGIEDHTEVDGMY